MSTIEKLQEWYLSQCNEDWEHQYGVQITNIDNPGWELKVDLVNTGFEGLELTPFEYGVGEDVESSGNDWIICKVENNMYHAYGGPEKLDEMINIFFKWAEEIKIKR